MKNPKLIAPGLRSLILLIGLPALQLFQACNPQDIAGVPATTLRTSTIITPSGDTVTLDCDDDIPISSFPATVLDAVAAAYPDYTIHEGKICGTGPEIYYWFELYPVSPGGEDIDVAFDGAGTELVVIADDHGGHGGGGEDGCDDDDGCDDGDDDDDEGDDHGGPGHG